MTETERRDWREYRETGDVSMRNRLAERHLALVHHFARRMEPRSGGALERSDLVSAGFLGLLDAVSAFDPELGFQFSTFAATRIRGAMLDEIRRRDVAPRSVRRKQKRLDEANARLAVELDRAPRHREVAQVLEVDVQTLWRWKWDVARTQHLSLTDLTARTGREEVNLPAEESEVEDVLDRSQEVQRLRRELSQLDARDREIIELYDLSSWTLKEVAERLGVSESRVSQLRSRALRRLRARMQGLREVA